MGRPPTGGPITAATFPNAPQSPVASPCWCRGNTERRKIKEMGTTPAEPIACTTRNAMSWFTLPARPQAKEATVKMESAVRKTRLCPYRSASLPKESSRTARVMLKAFTHL